MIWSFGSRSERNVNKKCDAGSGLELLWGNYSILNFFLRLCFFFGFQGFLPEMDLNKHELWLIEGAQKYF